MSNLLIVFPLGYLSSQAGLVVFQLFIPARLKNVALLIIGLIDFIFKNLFILSHEI